MTQHFLLGAHHTLCSLGAPVPAHPQPTAFLFGNISPLENPNYKILKLTLCGLLCLSKICIPLYFSKGKKKSNRVKQEWYQTKTNNTNNQSNEFHVGSRYSGGTYFHFTEAISNFQKLLVVIGSWQPGGVFGPDIKQRGGTVKNHDIK